MSDLIDRQAAISAICNACGKIDCDKMGKCEKLQLPPANNSEIPNSSDMISRAKAIDALKQQAETMSEWSNRYAEQRKGVLTAVNIVEDLPPAQPEPHWIPVTEDTPTEDDDYWATFDAETGRFVDWASWYQGRWVVWIEGSPAPLSNVIAWCKPIEPYKEVTE